MSAQEDETAPGAAAPGAAALTPADAVELRALSFARDGTVPDDPVRPALPMRGAIAPDASPGVMAMRPRPGGRAHASSPGSVRPAPRA